MLGGCDSAQPSRFLQKSFLKLCYSTEVHAPLPKDVEEMENACLTTKDTKNTKTEVNERRLTAPEQFRAFGVFRS